MTDFAKATGHALTILGSRAAICATALAITASVTVPARAADDALPAMETPFDSEGPSEFVEPADIDWSILNTDPVSLSEASAADVRRKAAAVTRTNPWSWNRSDRPDGSSAVTIKQSVSSFLDTQVGADLNVERTLPVTSADVLRQTLLHDTRAYQSTGSAWAAITAPGVKSIWDKTAVEARTDPTQDQSRISASMTKTIPFGNERSLTLQNGYNVTQQTLVPLFGLRAASHIAEVDQSAKLGIASTGTSFIAGQTHSSGDDKWLRRIGAEQTIFDRVTVTGSISQTADGTPNRSLTAGYSYHW